MPRHARLDSPGTLHHVIVRGIERRKIVDDDVDRLSPDAIRFSRIPSHIAARNVHSVWLGFTGSIRSNAFPKQSDFRERNNFFGYQMIPDSASRASNTRTFLFVSNGWVRRSPDDSGRQTRLHYLEYDYLCEPTLSCKSSKSKKALTAPTGSLRIKYIVKISTV